MICQANIFSIPIDMGFSLILKYGKSDHRFPRSLIAARQ